MSDTIHRLLVTFVDIIYSSDKEWTEDEILQKLRAENHMISQSTLNRDLNRYHGFFNVERLDKHNSNNQKPVYKRTQRKFTESVMPKAEIQLLTAIAQLKDQLDDLLTPEAREYLEQQMAKMNKQRVHLLRNVPQHALFDWENNLSLILKYEKEGVIQRDILKALSKSLNNNMQLEIVSNELNGVLADSFTPIRLYEQDGDLYMTGMSELNGGTNFSYCLSKLSSALCVEYPLQTSAASGSPRFNRR